MPEINLMTEKNMPEEVKNLFVQAKQGQISYKDFFAGLEKHNIKGFEKALYACKAFDISLNEAKQLFIEEEYGSVEKWANTIHKSLDKIEFEKS